MIKKINLQKIFIVLIIVVVLILCTEVSMKNLNTNEINTNNTKENNIQELVSINNTINDIKEEYNNEDIVGRITIENTSIDELVAQSTDNDYYLTHNINKEYDKYGTIYMDYRININKSKKILIYGHNSSIYNKDVVPFQELENYYNESYYKSHKYITLTLGEEIRNYEIFSVYIETSDFTYMNLNFRSNEDWYNHITKLKNKSLYDTKVNITEDDEILILQTCSNNKDYANYEKKYLLIISRRV